MASEKQSIFVYLHTFEMSEPELIGTLSSDASKGHSVFSFEYQPAWIKSQSQFVLDPDLAWYSGKQFPNNKSNFGIFFDSMPDTWGRTLLKRRAALIATTKGEKPRPLYNIDFLLAVHDKNRMGAIRLKTDPEGDFLDNNENVPIPPWSSIHELQFSALVAESDEQHPELSKWLTMLVAPGSSLGGARPKANILDENGHPWIAKFPSKNDTVNKALWELLAYKLAIIAGIEMAESKALKIAGSYHTFFTKRFDRIDDKRIHFASAMCLTGNSEENIRNNPPSYLEIAEFIQYHTSNPKKDLEQLWRRMVFNIAISNTDDHMRNHGFLLKNNQWQLSPAYDINPSTDKNGLALNIDLYSNALDFELAKSVGQYFQLNTKEMEQILNEVSKVVSGWSKIAMALGISSKEIELMQAAFNK